MTTISPLCDGDCEVCGRILTSRDIALCHHCRADLAIAAFLGSDQ